MRCSRKYPYLTTGLLVYFFNSHQWHPFKNSSLALHFPLKLAFETPNPLKFSMTLFGEDMLFWTTCFVVTSTSQYASPLETDLRTCMFLPFQKKRLHDAGMLHSQACWQSWTIMHIHQQDNHCASMVILHILSEYIIRHHIVIPI